MSKLFLGFYDAAELGTTGHYTLYATELANRYNILRINTDDPNIYYLIENRQYTGFDAGLYMLYGAGEGALVLWRLDQKELYSRWQVNTVNNEDGRYGLMPVFVNGVNDPFWSRNSSPNVAVLQGSLRLWFSELLRPDGGMEITLDRLKAADVPVTGDRFWPALWFGLGLAALTGAALLCFLGRKKRGRAKR